jgi:hypothetical protein
MNRLDLVKFIKECKSDIDFINTYPELKESSSHIRDHILKLFSKIENCFEKLKTDKDFDIILKDEVDEKLSQYVATGIDPDISKIDDAINNALQESNKEFYKPDEVDETLKEEIFGKEEGVELGDHMNEFLKKEAAKDGIATSGYMSVVEGGEITWSEAQRKVYAFAYDAIKMNTKKGCTVTVKYFIGRFIADGILRIKVGDFEKCYITPDAIKLGEALREFADLVELYYAQTPGYKKDSAYDEVCNIRNWTKLDNAQVKNLCEKRDQLEKRKSELMKEITQIERDIINIECDPEHNYFASYIMSCQKGKMGDCVQF